MSRPHFLQPLLRRNAPPIVLRNSRSGLVLATVVETAVTSDERRKGLLGRDGLPPGHALVIAPTNLVHTFAMRFSIDIVFVRRDGHVLKVSPAVPRRRIVGAWGGFAVIEMAAGSAAQADVRPGDLLVLESPS
jgi:uncharacterized membrane protein (UPF0127 family)